MPTAQKGEGGLDTGSVAQVQEERNRARGTRPGSWTPFSDDYGQHGRWATIGSGGAPGQHGEAFADVPPLLQQWCQQPVVSNKANNSSPHPTLRFNMKTSTV